MSELERSWREIKLDIPAVNVKEQSFADNKPNIFIIKNNSSNEIFVADYPGVNTEDFEVKVPPKGQRIYQKPKVTEKLYFHSPLGSDIHISSFKGTFDQDSIHQTQEIVSYADLTKVTVESGTITIGDGEPIGMELMTSIPAGDNNIGNVDIVSIPAVDIQSLPSLPAGANNIGSVNIGSASTLETKLDSVITLLTDNKALLTQIEINTRPTV